MTTGRRGTPTARGRRRAWAAAAVATAALGLGCAVSGVQDGWRVTVYYTAVEAFHDPATTVDVVGCPVLDCSNGTEPLGTYPSTFATAVKDEGTGRITSGPSAGRYLNWSHGEGYWLDEAPRDKAGRPLETLRSAAADGVPDGTVVRLLDCGRAYDGGPVAPRVCSLLRGGRWEILDAFTPGFGGDRHIDLYIGEEDRPGFTRSELYTTLEGATLELTPPR
jgi:hypothetical protein